MTFGEIIKEKRVELKLSQTEAAKLIKEQGIAMSATSLSHYERMMCLPRHRSMINAIAKVYGLDAEKLAASTKIITPAAKTKECIGCKHYSIIDKCCCYLIDTGKQKGIRKDQCYRHQNTPYSPGKRDEVVEERREAYTSSLFGQQVLYRNKNFYAAYQDSMSCDVYD